MKKDITKTIDQGDAGRHLKPRWVSNGSVSPEAFDLRLNREPPENTVSFIEVNGKDDAEKVFNLSVLLRERGRTVTFKDYACILSIKEALTCINGEEQTKLICFVPDTYPHIGLRYSTSAKGPELLEIKNILSWLASQRLHSFSSINHCKK